MSNKNLFSKNSSSGVLDMYHAVVMHSLVPSRGGGGGGTPGRGEPAMIILIDIHHHECLQFLPCSPAFTAAKSEVNMCWLRAISEWPFARHVIYSDGDSTPSGK